MDVGEWPCLTYEGHIFTHKHKKDVLVFIEVAIYEFRVKVAPNI